MFLRSVPAGSTCCSVNLRLPPRFFQAAASRAAGSAQGKAKRRPTDGAAWGSDVLKLFEAENEFRDGWSIEKWFKIKEPSDVGA
jgi:hypothetical protein